ncbi:MAG: Calx-beta domain-containing protein [Planctomycetaceae bacterium]
MTSRPVIESLEDRALLAVQTITPSMTAVSVTKGDPATFDLNYQSDGVTGGLTLRMHFDSTELGFNTANATNVFASSSLGVDVQPDTGNEDGDATTDMVVVATWFDLTQSWPPAATTQPFSLLTANFQTANLNGSSTVNFTASPGGVGHTVDPITSVVISEAVAPLPTISIANATPVTEGAASVFTVTLSASPTSAVTVMFSTADGTATAGQDYTARTNQTLTFAANTTTLTQNISIATIDDTDVEAGAAETFLVNLTTPTNATIATGQATGTINDNDVPPTLSINDVTVDENAGTAVFTVTLSAASSQTVTVGFATANGTATAGQDYTATSGTATITAGMTTTTISVPILNNPAVEPSETFNVNLTNPVNATIADALGVGTIVDDDTLPTLAINNVTVDESAGNAVFTITLSAVSATNVSVNFATANGTATAGQDYTATSGTATIAAGMTTATVTVPIIDDTLDEADTERFNVNLTSPVNATIADAQGIGTINDDDLPPETGSIHGRKFNDLNANGSRDTNEPWLNGWTIQLVDSNGNVVDEQVTMDQDLDNNGTIDPATETGWYWFNSVLPGTYTLQEVVQDGWRQTTPSSELEILAFELDTQFDFVATGNNFQNWGGLNEKWFFGSSQWYYISPTGELFQWNGSPAIALTGISVAQLDATYHADTSLLTDARPATESATVVVTAGTEINNFDFGNFNEGQPGSIHGRKFDDMNGNGVHDAGEAWLNGWTIQLLDADGNVVDEQVTMDQDLNNNGTIESATESGLYWFNDVAPGTYTVSEIVQDGWEQTAPFNQDSREAYDLDQAEQLRFTGNLFENYGGLNERWLLGRNGWVYITPDGNVFKWNGSPRNRLSGSLIAELSPAFHADPSLLYDAPDPSGLEVTVGPGQIVEDVDFGNRLIPIQDAIMFPGTGNISLEISRGDVILTGDSGHNGVIIYLNGNGYVTIEGLGRTTVNGSPFPQVLNGWTSIPDDLRISLRSGNDAVVLQGIQIGNDLNVNLDGGNNYLLADGLLVRDNLIYRSGAGDDIVGVRNSQVNGRVSVATDGGNDTVGVDNVLVAGTSLLTTGAGNDLVLIGGSTYQDNATLLMDGGQDSLAVDGNNSFGGNLTANGGALSDGVAMQPGNSFAKTPKISAFERDTLPNLDSMLDAVLQELADVGLDVVVGDAF